MTKRIARITTMSNRQRRASKHSILSNDTSPRMIMSTKKRVQPNHRVAEYIALLAFFRTFGMLLLASNVDLLVGTP
jgi:hypothetical protein